VKEIRPGWGIGADLTDRQAEIVHFIANFFAEHNYWPTLREIGKHFGIRSTNGVNDHLRALERKGYIKRHQLLSRANTVPEWFEWVD